MEPQAVTQPTGGGKPQGIEFPELRLRHCSTDEHCRALLAAGELPFWWYQEGGHGAKNFALPFQDSKGTWWYQVRSGFAWPVDATEAYSSAGRRLPLMKSFLAYQHVVAEGEASDSSLVINMIMDLAAYSPKSIIDKRRSAIRKGGRSCEVIALDKVEDRWLPGAVKCWNDLVERTGWKHVRDESFIRGSWSRLIEQPAATILLAVDRATGGVAGFLITKIYGRTAYVDTIASNSDLLDSNPNDILMWTFLCNAQRLAGVERAHYAIKSSIEGLEKFKLGLGFVHHPFPARLHARPGMMTALKLLKPETYKRLTGQG